MAPGNWSEAEIMALYKQIIDQLMASGATIKWDLISLPGRSARALSERYYKLAKEGAPFNAANSGGQPVAPAVRAPRAPRGKAGGDAQKRKVTPKKEKVASVFDDDYEDDEDELETTPLLKRTKSLATKDEIKDENDKEDDTFKYYDFLE